MRKNSLVVSMIALALLAAVPALAADGVITNGVDLWLTKGDGGTYADFSKMPIPAGFFCFKSKPFTGRIVFRGIPVATSVPGALGATDTIVQRLDDAPFNKRNVAATRIQVRALQFESIAPVKTACGPFNVKVVLDGDQPITRMRIIRENEGGGRFLAPIHVNVKLSFTPVRGAAKEILEVTRSLRFAPNPKAQWAESFPRGVVKSAGFVLADTDGDGVPDTHLPGTSNFAAGWSGRAVAKVQQARQLCAADAFVQDPTCHIEDSCGHCTSGVCQNTLID